MNDRSVAIAGAIALPLVTLGFCVSVLPLVIALLVLLVVLVGGAVAGVGAGGVAFIGFLAVLFGMVAVDQNPWLILIPAIIGLVLFVGGIVGSIRFLRARQHPRPVALTWSGVCVGLMAQVIVNGAIYLGDVIVTTMITGSANPLFLWRDLGQTIGFLVVAIPATAGLGALIWTWLSRAQARRAAMTAAVVAP